jgi:hypothetical protein
MAHFLLRQVMADYVGSICGLRVHVQNALSIAANAGEWLLSADCIHCRLCVFLLWQMPVGHVSTPALQASSSALVSSRQLRMFPVEMLQCCYLLFCECFFEHVR